MWKTGYPSRETFNYFSIPCTHVEKATTHFQHPTYSSLFIEILFRLHFWKASFFFQDHLHSRDRLIEFFSNLHFSEKHATPPEQVCNYFSIPCTHVDTGIWNFHSLKKQQFILIAPHIQICSSKFCFVPIFVPNLQPLYDMIAIISNFKFSKTQKVIFNAQCIETGTSSFQMNHSFERNLQPICSKMTFWNFKPTFQTGSSNFLLDSNFVRKKVLYSLIASVSKFEILKSQQFIFHVQSLKTGSSKTFRMSVFVKNMLSLCNNFMTIFSKSRPRVDIRNFHCSKKQQFIFNTQYIQINSVHRNFVSTSVLEETCNLCVTSS